jgi:pantoate--beta-alanine ligase
MKIVRTVSELRAAVAAARAAGTRVGLVPTMGAFHEGHLSLMRRARERCGLVIVSLFVNPTQFTEASDLERYPRNEDADVAMAENAGTHILFAPGVAEVYPAGFATVVEVSGISEPLEGIVRGASHFRAVATVVAKLLNMAQPDEAFFGQKDAQQAMLIRQMARDLDMPVDIVVYPTVREPDGLAMSSRNVLLDAASRAKAPALYEALSGIADAVADGERKTTPLLARGAALLESRGIVPEYLAIVAPDTFADVATIDDGVLCLVAARFGAVRLIDNILLAAGWGSE